MFFLRFFHLLKINFYIFGEIIYLDMIDNNKDSLGIAFNDFINGEKDAVVKVLCDIADEDVVEVKYFFRKYDELPEIEKIALDNCYGKILDVGAGSGCHSLILREKGADVKPIDISKLSVNVMKAQGLENAEVINFFDIKDKYDTLLMLMNGAGICGDLKGLDLLFKQAKKILNKTGQIIIDSSDLKYLYKEDDGSFKINLSEKYYGEVFFQVKYKNFTSEKFKWLFVDYYTLEDIALSNGFLCELLYYDDSYQYLAKIILK